MPFLSAKAKRRKNAIGYAEKHGVSAACALFKISKTQFYYWKLRFKKLGPSGLENERWKPRTHPMSTPKKVFCSIIRQRRSDPTKGAETVAKKIESFLGHAVSATTIRKIWHDEGLMEPAQLTRQVLDYYRTKLLIPVHVRKFLASKSPKRLRQLDRHIEKRQRRYRLKKTKGRVILPSTIASPTADLRIFR